MTIGHDTSKLTCNVCGHEGLRDGDDGFFYCQLCDSQAEDIRETALPAEDHMNLSGTGAVYALFRRQSVRHAGVKAEPVSQGPSFLETLSQNIDGNAPVIKKEAQESSEPHNPADHVWPEEPADFPGEQEALNDVDYCNEVRMRYVAGIQLMIQYQCETLVEKFRVSPLICGIAGSVWLRYVAATRVFDETWADEVMLDSEKHGQKEFKDQRIKYAKNEPRNIFNRRMVIIWFKYLRKKIPLSCSFAVSYLACHIAREAILPTDIRRWIMEGKLPFFAAFTKIEETIGRTSRACPLTASYMFRPSHVVPLLKLESMAGSIAECIGLNLPPVNFYDIASHYLREMSLPVEKILPYACRIFEWSMPPELWLSASEFRLPTRVCVMSIIIVAIRILYNINGLGKWEMSLSTSNDSSSLEDQMKSFCLNDHSDSEGTSEDFGDLDEEPGRTLSSTHKFESEAAELLCNLEKRFSNMPDNFEPAKDFPSYIQFCREVVFSGLAAHDYTDEDLLRKLKWADEEPDFGSNRKRSRADTDSDDSDSDGDESPQVNQDKRIPCRSPEYCGSHGEVRFNTHTSPADARGPMASGDAHSKSLECGGSDGEVSINPHTCLTDAREPKASGEAGSRDAVIRMMKTDMEENRFIYIPPREKVKRSEYLHYARKRDDGSLSYISHADYYILLRACAKVVEVDTRIMHCGVLSLERRLAWIENRIAYCLHVKPSDISCRFCSKEVPEGKPDLNL